MDLSTNELFNRISNILSEVSEVYEKLETLPGSNGNKPEALYRRIKNKPVEIEAIKASLRSRKVKVPDQVQTEIDQIELTLREITAHNPALLADDAPLAKSGDPTASKTVPLGWKNSNLQNSPLTGSSRFFGINKSQGNSSTVITIIGLFLSIAVTVIITNGDAKLSVYVIGGILSLFMAVFIFLKPELGAYLLIVTTISNLSDLFTESGLPSINQPLVVLILFFVLANQFLRTGRVNITIHLTRVEWALAMFYLIMISTIFVARDRASAVAQVNGFTRSLVILYCIIASLNSPQKWKRGIWVAIITTTILSSFGAFQLFTGNTSFTFWGMAKPSILGQYTDEGVLRYGGPIGESNIWAQTLLAVLCFAIYRIFDEPDLKVKFYTGVASLIIITAIFYTYSRGAFVATLIVLFLIALERHIDFTKILMVVGAGVVILAFLPQTYLSRISTLLDIINPHNEYSISSDESIIGRSTVIQVGLSMFAEHPFLGVGVGNYQDQYWDFAPKLGLEAGTLSTSGASNTREPHNLYVELLATTGIFGFMFFFLFYYILLKALSTTRSKLWASDRYKDRSSWIASITIALISFLFTGLFLHGAFYRYLWMFIAIAMAGYHLYGDTKSNSYITEETR
jgi:O-antigen ligase